MVPSWNRIVHRKCFQISECRKRQFGGCFSGRTTHLLRPHSPYPNRLMSFGKYQRVPTRTNETNRIPKEIPVTPHALKLPTTIARSQGCRLDRPDRPCDANLAIPAFYNHPKTISDMVDHIVARVLDQFGISARFAKRWDGRMKNSTKVDDERLASTASPPG